MEPQTSITVIVVVLLVCMCRYSSTLNSGGCLPIPPLTLTAGLGTYSNGVPTISATGSVLRPQVGGRYADAWSVFSSTQITEHALWCQVSPINNASNLGDWYYSSEGQWALVPTDDPINSVPYQSMKCTNQIGLVVDGLVSNNQGIVMCNTTIPNLDRNAIHWVVYSDSLYENYNGPRVEPTMTLTIHSSRDADPNVEFSFSFTVSFGPPSSIRCLHSKNVEVFFVRGINPGLVTRKIIRTHYINMSEPDETHVTIKLAPQPRANRKYTCIVTVEGRQNISTGNYTPIAKGSGSTTASITVAGTPVGVTVCRIALTSARVSWTAPSPAPAGYEVFYQKMNGSRLSAGNTSDTELTLTGLILGETYSIFVVAHEAEDALVLSSAHSNTATITLLPGPVSSLSTIPEAVQLTISWSPPSKPHEDIITYEFGFNDTGNFSYTNTSIMHHTLKWFSPNTIIAFSVRAYSNRGPGEKVTRHVSTGSVPHVTGVSADVLNTTAVTVSWTPVNLTVVDHYTVHYIAVDEKRSQCDRGSFNISAGSSSGVVSGLMTGEQYLFSMSVTVFGGGQYYTGPVSDPTDPVTVAGEVPGIIVADSSLTTIIISSSVGGALLIISVLCNVTMLTIIVRGRHMRKQNITHKDLNMTQCTPHSQSSTSEDNALTQL